MAPPPLRARGRRTIGRGIAASVVVGLAVGAVTGAGPAVADGSSSVTLTANGTNGSGRTLVLTDLTNAALSTASGLTASNGSVGFITGVTDNNYTNNGYTVQASMTNLYRQTGTNTYDCTDSIPSSAVSVAETGSLDLTNISASFQPVFDLAGTLLSGTVTLPGSPNTKQVTGGVSSLTATQLLGAGNASLATVGTLTGLPVNAAKGSSATFTNPAAFTLGGGCSGGGSGASTGVLLSGTKNPGGVQGVLSTLLGSPGTITAQSLIDKGYTTLDAVKLAVAPLVTGGLAVLNTLSITALTAVVNTIKAVTQSGTYKVSPTLTVNVPSTANGQYVGVMTVTLADI